jgi:hypothetical protein
MAYQEDFTTALEVAFQGQGLTLSVVNPTVFMLQVPNADAPTTDGVQGTNITGQLITFQTRRVLEITVGAGITAGNQATVTFNNVQYAVTANANAPLATVVRGATVQQTPNAGLGTDRRLVVYEANNADPDKGRLIALPPDQASGVPLPTFRVTNALPITGSVIGDAVYVTATRQGYVWDGVSWRDITASPIRGFPNDAALQANTTEPVGSYAIATDSGNLYVRTPGGWRRIGVSEFSTYADLLSYDAPEGSQASCEDLGVLFLRVENGGVRSWVPISQMVKTQAQILATQNIRGLVAVATDTASTFINDGTRWIEDPIEHYPTEVGLLAATPKPGHIAWADDTAQVFVAVNPGTGAAWRRLQGPNVAVGSVEPTGNAAGDLWLRPGAGTAAQNYLEVYDGAAWQSATPAQPIGTIIQSLLTEAQFNASLGPVEAAKWCLADGRSVAGSKYAQITGSNNIPDLRGAFIRAAGQNSNNQANWNGGSLGTWHNDTTRTPRGGAFTGTTDNIGSHRHLEGTYTIRATNRYGNIIEGGNSLVLSNTGVAFSPREQSYTSSDGNHTHAVTVNGGGDAETAPVHYSLNTFLRIN